MIIKQKQIKYSKLFLTGFHLRQQFTSNGFSFLESQNVGFALLKNYHTPPNIHIKTIHIWFECICVSLGMCVCVFVYRAIYRLRYVSVYVSICLFVCECTPFVVYVCLLSRSNQSMLLNKRQTLRYVAVCCYYYCCCFRSIHSENHSIFFGFRLCSVYAGLVWNWDFCHGITRSLCYEQSIYILQCAESNIYYFFRITNTVSVCMCACVCVCVHVCCKICFVVVSILFHSSIHRMFILNQTDNCTYKYQLKLLIMLHTEESPKLEWMRLNRLCYIYTLTLIYRQFARVLNCLYHCTLYTK